MTFQITSLYTAIFTVFVIVLASVVSAQRARAKVSILHGGDMTLALWMRRHGNLVENVPLALILMGLCEANGATAAWLHGFGIVLIVARLLHVVGLTIDNPAAPLRIAGGGLTQLPMLAASAWLVWIYL